MSLQQCRCYLLARQADDILKSLYDLRLVQFRTQFDGGSRIGERLEFLGLHQRSIQIEDDRSNHVSTSIAFFSLPTVFLRSIADNRGQGSTQKK